MCLRKLLNCVVRHNVQQSRWAQATRKLSSDTSMTGNRKPIKLNCELAKYVAKSMYGLSCVDVKSLHGYADTNFWLKEKFNGDEYVLRMIGGTNLADPIAARKTDELIELLSSNGFKVPRLIHTRHGRRRSNLSVDENDVLSLRKVQLSVFRPGKTIFERKLTHRQLMEVAADVGSVAGLMHECILAHSSIDEVRFGGDDVLIWFTHNFHHLIQYIDHVKNSELKGVIQEVIEAFKVKVHPLLPELRYGSVHGDFSDTNIVLIEGKSLVEEKDKLGIIDFEDGHYGTTVFDLTVCVAYMMIKSVESGADALKIAKIILSSYNRVLPLTSAEKDVIFLGVMARLASSYVMSRYHLLRNPENEVYLDSRASKCPKILKKLWSSGEKSIMRYWFEHI